MGKVMYGSSSMQRLFWMYTRIYFYILILIHLFQPELQTKLGNLTKLLDNKIEHRLSLMLDEIMRDTSIREHVNRGNITILKKPLIVIQLLQQLWNFSQSVSPFV